MGGAPVGTAPAHFGVMPRRGSRPVEVRRMLDPGSGDYFLFGGENGPLVPPAARG